MGAALASDEAETRGVGAPSLYTPELGESICEMAAEGNSIQKCARKFGLAPRTLFRWMREHADTFGQQYAQARKDAAYLLAEETIEIADDSGMDYSIDAETGRPVFNGEHVQRARLRWDARRWLASKYLPKMFGDKVEHEVKGEVKHTHTMDPQGVIDSIISLANEQPITIAPMRALMLECVRRLDAAEAKVLDLPAIEHQP